MKEQIKSSKTVETYVRAINAGDAAAFESAFAPDAVVNDAGREIRSLAAIMEWARHEIFAVDVSLELMNATERDGWTVITVKVDGTFDRTGPPDPLIMDHSFMLAGEKIATLACRLTGDAQPV
jgi:hypothetical protein